MTETRKPLAYTKENQEQVARTVATLRETYATTGTLTEEQFEWLIRGVELTEKLMISSADFSNIAEVTVSKLNGFIEQQEEELAEKDREIAALSIQLRDKERDLELVNAES